MTLQGKRMASLIEIIPAFDELLSHLEEQRQYQNSLPSPHHLSSARSTMLGRSWMGSTSFPIKYLRTMLNIPQVLLTVG